jgi:hypothetical protein
MIYRVLDFPGAVDNRLFDVLKDRHPDLLLCVPPF